MLKCEFWFGERWNCIEYISLIVKMNEMIFRCEELRRKKIK